MRPSHYLPPLNVPSGAPVSCQLTSVCPDPFHGCSHQAGKILAPCPGKPPAQTMGRNEETQDDRDKAT